VRSVLQQIFVPFSYQCSFSRGWSKNLFENNRFGTCNCVDMKEYKFEAVIIKHETLDSGFIEFPYDVQKEFGKKGQVKVKAFFDGFEYRGSLVKMGHHCHIIGLNKKVRGAIGKAHGEKVGVVIYEDIEERKVDLPTDLETALKAFPAAKTFFDSLSITHKKEYIEWVTSAKKSETRISRIEKCTEMLDAKMKERKP
jgi:hypothetical protein